MPAENNVGYGRDAQSEDWIDAERDCQNTCHEVLIAESQATPTFSSTSGTVTAGHRVSFDDAEAYTRAAQVQIDHLIPVAEAWGSGAQCADVDAGTPGGLLQRVGAERHAVVADPVEAGIRPSTACRLATAADT